MTVADACAELAHLAPMLGPALRRDNTQGGGRGRPIAPLNLYNTDVLIAKITISAEVPAAAMRCSQLTGEPWPQNGRTWAACLRGLPRWHDRLHALGLATGRRERDDGTVISCCHLATLTARWVRITKQALGLASRPRQLMAGCPYCTATLMLDIATEGYMDAGDLTAPPSWVDHGAHVYCPGCEADWPQPKWELLIRILEQAERQVAP